MKNYIMYDKPKYRSNVVIIIDNQIIVKHDNFIAINNVKIANIFDDTCSKNEVISELMDITGGYCNEYLKNILKTKRFQFLSVWDNSIYDDINKELSNDFKKYTTIFNEKELSNIIFNFGKSIYSISKVDFNQIYFENSNIEDLFRNSLNTMVNNLKSKYKRLEKIIGKFIYKIGIEPKINKQNNSSNWNIIIYVSLLSYLYKESVLGRIKLKINLLELLKYVLFKLNINTNNCEYKMYKFRKDTKETIKIKSIIPFIIYYLENHYYYMEYYDDWIIDHKKDVLDDFRQTTIVNTNSNKKKLDYQSYDYKRLNDLYNRKIKNY